MGDGEVCLVLDPASLGLKTSNNHVASDDAIAHDSDNT
jgi:hypothetical protein